MRAKILSAEGEATSDTKPTELQQAIAGLRNDVKDCGEIHIKHGAAFASYKADILAVCAAAEAATVEGYTAAEWKGYADQWATEQAKWRQRAEQAEQQLARCAALAALKEQA
jgi:hypothetical protein